MTDQIVVDGLQSIAIIVHGIAILALIVGGRCR